MFRPTGKYLFAALALLPSIAGSYAYAQTAEQDVARQVKNSEDKNYISVSVENDSIGGGTDRFYTSGVRLTWFNVNTPIPPALDELAEAVPTFDLNATTSTSYTIGHNIFTPEDITVTANQPDDRPYAAFLYGSAGLTTLDDNHIDEFELTLGIVGPEALGEEIQDFVHREITDSDIPRGWDNQLKFEPGLIISAGRRWPRAIREDIFGLRLRGEPNINMSLGNVYTYAGGGITFTIGPVEDGIQDTPMRVRPAMPGSGYIETPADGWSWFGFAGVDGRAIGRNIFLDGNTFKSSNDIEKKYFVGDVNAGVAFTYDDYRLSYTYTVRSKEFDGQDRVSEFGSLTLSTKF